MRIFTIAALSCAVVLGQQTFTNDDVVRLVKQGIPPDEIVRAINKAPAVSFRITPQDQPKLLQAGVARPILNAMIQRVMADDSRSNIRSSSEVMPTVAAPARRSNKALAEQGRPATVSSVISNPLPDGNLRGDGGSRASSQSVSPPNPTLSGMLLHDGTPVKLRLNRDLSSADAKVGESVDFEVLEDVKVGDTVVIARGATALATVTEARPRSAWPGEESWM